MSDNTENNKTLSVETVFQSKYFRIKRKKIQRNGKTFTKDFIEKNPAVFILPITDKGEIYLELQYRDAFDKTVLEIVAGNMEHAADPLEAAKRELTEETGLTAQNWKLLATWELSVSMNAMSYIYVATGLTKGEPKLDTDEELTVIKMPFEKALEKVITGEFVATTHVAAILLYDKLKKEGKV